MAKYCVKLVEKILYEVYVEANNEVEAETKVLDIFGESEKDITDSWIDEINVEEEK